MISVVLAVWNEERFIKSTVLSILRQEGVEFEVIVVDDNSTDSTPIILGDLAKTYDSIKVYKNPNDGKVSAFNYGVSLSQGQYICLFAGDDIMPAGSLVERYNVVKERNFNLPVVGLSKIRTLSEQAKLNGIIKPTANMQGSYSGQSPLMSRGLINLVFPVPETLPNEDTWLEIIFQHYSIIEVIHSNVVCCDWRIHDGNSYKLSEGRERYRDKMYSRWKAYNEVLDAFGQLLPEATVNRLQHRVKVNEHFNKGSILKVLLSRVPFREKVRMVSIMSSLLFIVRSRFFGV